MAKLSDTIARTAALPAGKTDLIIWDSVLVGFGLRVRKVAKGISKQWCVQYRDSLRDTRRFIIGSVSEMGAVKARDIAADQLANIRLGKFPHVEREQHRKEAERERDRAIETFGAVSALYLDRQQRALRERSFAEVKRHIEKHWGPFHRTSVHDINRRMIALRLTEIATASGPVASNRARATLSGLFSWMVREGICEHNVVIGTSKAIDEVPRDRVLTDAELRAIWLASDDYSFGRIVMILMLTGQRREEVGGMLWDELNFEERTWTLSASRVKSGRKHVLPLTSEVIGILEKVPRRGRREGAEDHVFGAGGKGGFSGWALAKLALDARITEATGKPIAGWTLHDLRRTMRTVLSDKLDVRTEIAEALLNHSKKGLERVYNTSQYLAQKRAALELWADYLRPVINGSDRKVVQMIPPVTGRRTC
jgi:integrase